MHEDCEKITTVNTAAKSHFKWRKSNRCYTFTFWVKLFIQTVAFSVTPHWMNFILCSSSRTLLPKPLFSPVSCEASTGSSHKVEIPLWRNSLKLVDHFQPSSSARFGLSLWRWALSVLQQPGVHLPPAWPEMFSLLISQCGTSLVNFCSSLCQHLCFSVKSFQYCSQHWLSLSASLIYISFCTSVWQSYKIKQ